MKKKIGITGRILCLTLVLMIAVQAASLTIAGVGAELVGALSSGGAKGNSVLPDADNGQWVIPEAGENPNKVDMTINTGLVYTNQVYERIGEWGYLDGYQSKTNPKTHYWEDITASAGPMAALEYSYDNINGNWINHPYITTRVKKNNGTYGIESNILTPKLVFGGWNNIICGEADQSDMLSMMRAARVNANHATMRITANSAKSGTITVTPSNNADIVYRPQNGRIVANLNLKDYFSANKGMPGLTISLPNDDVKNDTISAVNVAFIDNTSPSIQSIDITQVGDKLEVKLKTNEGVRWADASVGEDLDDIWVEVELQVVGTEYKQKVRAHVAGISYRYGISSINVLDNDFSNTIIFRGDLGPFANLDYTVLDISDASMVKRDYPINFGTILMYANQAKDSDIRNVTLAKWDDENKKTVYETYDTTAICDTAGNALNLETVVNWPINQKEIKNNSTFVRKIELINDKILLGTDMKNADGFLDDVTRADYFFGPNDEIAPRLSLNQILTNEEAASFKVKTNVKDEDGEYIWLSARSTGSYRIKNEEFMYIDFEPLVLSQKMSADAQNGTKSYFEVIEISGDITESPALVYEIPSPEKTLYIDLAAPVVTVKSNSLTEPAAQDGCFKLDIEVAIEDAKIDGMLQAGVLEQLAYFYLSGNVNETTPIRFVVNTTAAPPSTADGYTGEANLVEGGKIKLGDVPIGLATDSAETNKAFIHLLIPQKANLLIQDFKVYADVCDTVGNRTDTDFGYDIQYHIDRQSPELSVTSLSTVYTSSSAVTTVKVDATDYNKVESVSYQWVESGDAYNNDAWESAIVDPASKVAATITKEFGGTDGNTYDMTLYIKCRDDRGNESLITQKQVKINIEKPSTVYEANSDLSSPSTHPEILISGPVESSTGKTGYTRVTVSPLNPSGDWSYVTVVESGKVLDVFALNSDHGRAWYKVKTSGAMYTLIEEVDGESVTLDDLKNYYGNVKISFENAFEDLTPRLGYKEENITDGSYIADQNFLTARFASQDIDLNGVNATDFGKVTSIDGKVLSANGDAGENTLSFSSSERGVNSMRGVAFYFDISNIRMSDWGLLDIDFENSTVELLRSDKTVTDEVVYKQVGLAQSAEQYFTIPAYTQNDEWFETGIYKIRVTVRSRSGSVDVAESLNIVYDACIPSNDGLRAYSHDLRYENGAYRPLGEDTGIPKDSFGISVQPGLEAHRNTVFAVYTGGVTGFSFTIGADDVTDVYDGITIGGIEGFRYWNSLSAPTEEDLAGYSFRRDESGPRLTVTSGVESIYTEDTIPKGTAGLGRIYLVEGVNVICYQVKMANGYISPVKQFTIIVTQYIPEFNVIVEDYTPSYYAAQRDGQVNADDITMRIEEAFSLNGSGNVNVEIWSNYAMTVNGEWVAETEENSQTLALTCLTDNLKAGDTAVLTEDSYTTCFPPYSGQGNYCTAVFAAIDEYGGMVVYAPQIGALSRVYDSSNPISDNYAIEYYGDPQDDPFTIGHDTSFITIYNKPVYFGEQLVGFENLTSRGWGPYEQTETSIATLEYNLFAIKSNDVYFGGSIRTGSGAAPTVGIMWRVNGENDENENQYYYNGIQNYELIDWSKTTISLYDEDGNVLAEGLDVHNPGTNAAGYFGTSYGEIYYPDTGERELRFGLNFANPMATDDNVGSEEKISFTINGENIYGTPFEAGGTVNTKYIDYSSVTQAMTRDGIVLELPFVSADYGTAIHTGIFNGADQPYSIEVTDAFGVKHAISGTYTENFDVGTDISYSTHQKTSEPVKVTLRRADGVKLYVDVMDADVMNVEGNGTSNVTVTLYDSIRFGYKYVGSDGEVSKILEVANVVIPKPYISVDVDTDIYLVDDEGVAYRYGNVTVTLRDDNFELTDIYTGDAPKYTFIPGGPASYTFSRDEIMARFGEEAAMNIPESLTYTINFELREVIDPLAEVTVADAPAVKINAFKEDRGYFNDEKLSLIIEPSGTEGIVADGTGVTMRYSGKRVNASAFLSKLGWGTAYRFLAEVAFDGAYKTFIKQGIYNDAPDYTSGMSDSIDGVTLNGRILTVEKNAQFTFFVVARNGNYTSVVFDIKDIGNAPRPTTVKVPINDKTVKVYIIKPEEATDFTATPADVGITVKTDAEGDYANVPYVEFDKNDDYIINYSFTYNGETVKGQLDASIYEIRVREMAQVGLTAWSANNTLESTAGEVSATLNFNELITAVEVVEGELDESTIGISYSGKQLKITFADNHGGFTLKVSSAYGDVVATVAGVSNIDRETPTVKEISRELSADGKKVTVTLATSERTVFREGGYIGEQSKDEDGSEIYVYTRTVTENGSYTYHFTDMGGLETSITVEVDEIVTEALTLYFSADKDLDSAVTDPSVLEIKSGDKIYVTPSMDADISVNGGDEQSIDAGEWLEIVLSDDVGGSSPYVTATDAYGRIVIRQFSQIKPKDVTAPIVMVLKPVITVVAGIDRSELEALLLANVTATDNDGNITYAAEFTDDLSASGTTKVTLTATDSAGNASVAECTLRILSSAEPIVRVGEELIARDATYYAESGKEIVLAIDSEGQPYSVYMKTGIRTVAQMKIDQTDITDGYVKDAEVSLGALERGFYTVVIQTQSRDYFRIIIYVY